jgi:hypothetical protein
MNVPKEKNTKSVMMRPNKKSHDLSLMNKSYYLIIITLKITNLM